MSAGDAEEAQAMTAFKRVDVHHGVVAFKLASGMPVRIEVHVEPVG